jgi:hypothetical protein
MAAVGVVVGHWLAYILSVPRPHARARVLMASGHGYWMVAVKGAVILGFVSVGSVLARHLLERLRPGERRPTTWTSAWVRLSFLQVLAFTAMEVAERLAAHAPVGEMFDHHVFTVGLLVQVLVALVGGLALRMLARGAEGLVEGFARSAFSRPRSVADPLDRFFVLPRPGLGGAAAARGPPLPLGT